MARNWGRMAKGGTRRSRREVTEGEKREVEGEAEVSGGESEEGRKDGGRGA